MMTNKPNTTREKILKGLELTHQKLIKSKAERNLDLIISENGKIIKLHSKDLARNEKKQKYRKPIP